MTAPPFHRKIGGIHWFALGRVRIGVCWVKYPGVSRRMTRAFGLADQRPKAVPKRGSALPAGEARTRAREGRIATHPLCPKPFEWPEAERVTLVRQEPAPDMPAGDYTAMPMAKWRELNCQHDWHVTEHQRLGPRSVRMPRTAVFPWPPESKQ